MLCQEPWCFTPEQVARLTDWQIENLYFKPALARQQTAPTAPQGGTPPARPAPASTGPDGEPGSALHRGQCVRAYMEIQGLSRERAEEQYERQLAQWRAEQAGRT